MKKLIRAILLIFLINFNLYASYFIELDLPQDRFITQSESGFSNACTPTSLLYLLKLNPNRESYSNIPGENDFQKLDYIIEQGLSLSSPYDSSVVFDESGTAVDVDAYWLSALLPDEYEDPFFKFGNRLPHEQSKGDFLKRIHNTIKSFIESGKPIKIGAHFRRVADSNSEFALGHSVVVIAVQEKLEEGDLGFMIKYLDPVKGAIFSAYMYEDINERFNAPIWDEEFNSSWSANTLGVYNDNDEFVSSPYLRLVAPLMIPYKRWKWGEHIDAMVLSFLALNN